MTPTRRFISHSSLLLGSLTLVGSCGRTAHDAPAVQNHSDAGSTTSTQGEAGRGGTPGGTASVAGPILSLGGEPSQPLEPAKPTREVGTCRSGDLPGEPCLAEAMCWSTRCGVHFELACQAGSWVVDGSSLAFEMVCQPSDEFTYAIRDITTGACCGERGPRNEVTEPQSCELCPGVAPRDGEPCALPDDCNPRIIDCFYDCCCYGTTTWAQCDGESWHVATDCSGK